MAGVGLRFAPIMYLMNDAIEISCGPFTARLLPLGATLSRFQYHDRDLVLGFKDPSDHLTIPIYAGAIVGPVANRITNGCVQISSQTHQMPRNENGETTLHSGDDGLHAQRWNVVNQQSNQVVFECILADQACGLPGNRTITVEYLLDRSGLQVNISASSDTKTAMNIAHHPYWTLETDLAQAKLTVAAQHFLPVDAFGLPTGAIKTVADTPFNFRNAEPIGTASQLDHNYCLANGRRCIPHHAASLTAVDGLTLDITTTEPGLQVYAGSGLPDLAKNRTFGGKSQANAAIALEPQGWPDAPNNDNFPSIFIDVGDVYRQETRYNIRYAD